LGIGGVLATILDKIVETKKEELTRDKRNISAADIKKRALDAEPARPFLKALQSSQLNIIAEIKKASPSLGVIREDFDPLAIAHAYEENGARCLSVLTDEQYFKGSLAYINKIKKYVKLPCLRKDFTIHDYQIFQARAFGADAVLLIAAILEDSQLKDYQALAQELGMACLIEVHDAFELQKVNSIKPELIGVNNRDLKTFKVDIETSLNLLPHMGKQAVKISESGLKTGSDLAKLQKAGFNGFLIGESFMKDQDPGLALKKMIQETLEY